MSTSSPSLSFIESLATVASGLRHATTNTESWTVDYGGPPTAEEIFVAQLSRLASQHHASAYNCAKFGGKGALVSYVPLCLHMPEQFRQLQSLQVEHAQMQAWWPCLRTSSKSSVLRSTDPGHGSIPIMLRIPGPPASLQEDLLSAMTSPFTPQYLAQPRILHPSVKTSDTHPINITPVIPPDLLPLISAHASQPEHNSPIIFELLPSFQLHCLLAAAEKPAARPITFVPPRTAAHPTTASRRLSLTNLIWSQKLLRPSTVSSSAGSKAHSGRFSLNLHGVALSASGTRLSLKSSHTTIPSSTTCPTPVGPFESPTVTNMGHRRALTVAVPRPPSAYSSEKIVSCPGISQNKGIPPSPTIRLAEGLIPETCGRTLGNLFLSSCPGKKVRIDNPVNGRPGVHRDIYQDMKRIREFGAECLVCCLDDEELQFLGAPWQTYAQTAHGFGMDVLRLPMPEGLGPSVVERFDSHLQRIIDTYTLSGKSVLVHCRGGIGRAGLVACCWIIKLGLCGWVDTDPLSRPSAEVFPTAPVAPPSVLQVRRDTLEFLERIISLVRSRRSLKAIETFEQVRFLAEYVEYLRARGGPRYIQMDTVLQCDLRAV